MKTEINPQETSRAEAFSMWMSSPQPMVTVVKTFDVSRLRKASRKTGIKFNVLLCWCICKAASSIEEFYLLPEPEHLHDSFPEGLFLSSYISVFLSILHALLY